MLRLSLRSLVVFAFLGLPLALLRAQPVISGPGYTAMSVELGQTAVFSGITATGATPLTYQWVIVGSGGSMSALTDGTNGNGSSYSGAATRTLSITGTTAADAASYALEVTDSTGASRTSTSIALTVKPAAPPTITSQPVNTAVVAGNSASFSVAASGSYPRTFQWYKGTPSTGTAIPGATNATLSLTAVSAADAGSYYVVITNASGNATSTAATLTVNAATPITFSSVSPVTVTVGQTAYLSAYVQSGSYPITYQWQKNGSSIAGATNSSYNFVTTSTADSGSYAVVATNGAGPVTSPTITLTVNASVAPTISSQPSSLSIAQGNSANFYVGVNGSSPFTYQWQKNGTAISGATYSNYSINQVQSSDAGSYSVTVTNAAGSVTSSAATLTVLPPLLPTFYGSGTTQSATVGTSVTINGPSVSNNAVGPFTYQWYKNGTAMAGATGTFYTLTPQLSDAGFYVETLTNSAGTVNAPPIELTVTPAASNAPQWIDAVQQGSIVYFVFASHVERYDLSTSSWLASTALTQTATAAAAASDGLYIALGRSLARYSLDLSTQTTLANLGSSVNGLFLFGNYAYAKTDGGSIYPIDRTSGVVGTSTGSNLSSGTARFAVAAAATKVYTPNSIWGPMAFVIATDGSLKADNFKYYGTFPAATLAYLMPDGTHFADNGGTIYNVSDDTMTGTFGGAFTDMAFLSDSTPVVLRGNALYTYATGGTTETGHTALAVNGARVFASGQTASVFYPSSAGANGYVDVATVARSGFSSGYATASAVDASTLSFTPDAVVQDNAGTVYLYDAARENIYRWSPTTRSYLAPITLTGSPSQLLYSATLNRLFAVYRNRKITKIDLSSATPTEQLFTAFPLYVDTAASADNFLFAVLQDAQDSGEEEILLDAATGRVTTLVGWGYYGRNYTWSAANQTLYASGGGMQKVSSTGTLPNTSYSSGLSQGATGLIYPSADGSRLLAASGQVYDSSGLYLGVIGNAVNDVAWLGATPYTLRTAPTGSEVQVWSNTNFILAGSATLPGRPVRLLPLGTSQLLLVTAVNGQPAYTVLNAALQRVSTTVTTTSSGAPTFVGQPAPSLTVFAGSSVTLAVDTAGATPQSFQWSKNGTAISGATNSSLTFGSIGTGDAGNYSVTATNTAGAATSTTTNITVAPALAFTTQPQSQLVTYGGSATFMAAVANSTGASFQWFFNGTALSGATSSTLVVSPAYSSNYGTYVLKVSNAAGSLYSNPVTLAQDTKPTISTQPQSQTVTAGSSVSLYVYGSNASSYQWYFNGTPIAGQTNSTLYLNNVTTAMAGSYTVVLTGAGGSTTSAAATLTVLGGGPVITDPPHDFTAIAGNSASFGVSATGVTSYQWYFNGTAIAGATSGIYAIPVVTAANAGNYTVVLTGPGGTTTSPAAVLTVLQNTGIPTITSQPAAVSAVIGSQATFSVQGTNVTSYQWYFNGTPLAGQTTSLLSVPVTAATLGNYQVVLTGTSGSVASSTVTLSTPPSSYAGAYFGSFTTGGRWALWVPVSGTAKMVGTLPQNRGAFTAELIVGSNGSLSTWSSSGWSPAYSGVNLPSTITGTISAGTVSGNAGGDAGSYTGTLDSGTAANAVAGYYTASALNDTMGQSYAIVGGSGQTLVIWVNFQGTGTAPDTVSGTMNAQGQMSGTTALGRAMTASVDTANAVFRETLTPSGAAAIAFGGLPGTVANTAHLMNLSSRANVGTGADVLVTGFSIVGSGAKNMLVRGVGPGLATFGLTDALSRPVLTLNDAKSNLLWSGGAWGGGADLSSMFTQVGAFPLSAASADCAHIFQESTGGYSAVIAGANGATGVALAEVYDADGSTTAARLVNLSARANVGAGSGVLTAGLVVGGAGPETVLLRGIGPTLKSFGLTNALAAPKLTLYDGTGNILAVNTGWTDPQGMISFTSSKVSAFALAPNSGDAVLLVTLMPGNYSVQVSSQNNTTGVALVEVYEVK